jgi:putative transposase
MVQQFMAQRMMEMDVESLCGAGHDEKRSERLNSRNGFRDRSWEARSGTVALKLPALRSGSYFPGFLWPRRAPEEAMAAVIQ